MTHLFPLILARRALAISLWLEGIVDCDVSCIFFTFIFFRESALLILWPKEIKQASSSALGLSFFPRGTYSTASTTTLSSFSFFNLNDVSTLNSQVGCSFLRCRALDYLLELDFNERLNLKSTKGKHRSIARRHWICAYPLSEYQIHSSIIL